MSKYPIILGCDCDPDRLGFTNQAQRKDLSWEGIQMGIPTFQEARRRFHKDYGIWPKVTWFVRADYQIEKVYGHGGYCLQRFADLWQALQEEGDEIAWHPHLWDWSEQKQRWYQKVGDDRFTRKCLEIGYESFKEVWGSSPKTVHAGWCYQDDVSLKLLSDFGITADSSAVPGHHTLGHGLADQADWSRAKGRPYWPLENDYQCAAKPHQKALKILEIPASVGSGTLARGLKIIRDQFKRRSIRIRYQGFRTQVPLMTLKPWLNGKLIDSAVEHSQRIDPSYFFSYTHCDEFLPQHGKSGIPRLIYSLDSFFTNVRRLHMRVEENSNNHVYLTLQEFVMGLSKAKADE